MAELLPFPTPDRRCAHCLHWTPLSGPNGVCEIEEAVTNADWSCDRFYRLHEIRRREEDAK